MSLYQPTVLKEYLAKQDKPIIEKAYKKYKKYFQDPEIQRNIRASKEEQFQAKFLDELFSNIFGYTLHPKPNANLITEFKNQKNSRKADGAILKDGKAVAVIELKGTKTKDLESISTQAFGYKANQAECVYVITSNFEKLRFYISDATDHLEFNLFTLDLEQFSLLHLCLDAENLLNNLPQTIKKASLAQEEKITKEFYTDYSLFKRELFRDLVKKNIKNEIFRAELQKEDKDRASKNIKLSLFKKSQKLIDRFLFIFFAEDCQLLPANSTLQILDKWKRDVEFGDERQLYDIFKIYFKVLDEGRKGTERQAEIFAYNGGLFKPDNILSSLIIDNELLYEHTERLSNYDFSSQLDVNILGHIFENSLNDIESINAEIEGTDFDKQKTKRKKDGVFYTPKYITKYIVDSTVGKRCEDKRKEFEIHNEDFSPSRQMATKKKLLTGLDSYREWLLKITILDPACGSGAFLNQALDFLIHEHRKIDEETAQLSGSSIVFPDIENTILEQNIFGVDLNEESVEIAKLSLWLRTAQPRRKLTSLNNNIKCGNSLIDNPKIAGDKAFTWTNEFPEVFAAGGFDIIIGNPPYVQLQSLGAMSDSLAKCGYETFHKGADLYCLFTERAYTLLKPDGIQSFIMPNKWMLVTYGKPLRSFLSKTGLLQVLNFGDIQFFDGAAITVCIFVVQNKKTNKPVQVLSLNQKSYKGDFISEVKANLYDYATTNFGENNWSIQPYNDACKLKTMGKNTTPLKDLPISINYGIKTGYNEAFFIDAATQQKLIKKDAKSAELIKPMLRGRDITAYGITGFEYLISTFPSLKLDIEDYPAIKEHFLTFSYDRLKQTGDKGSRKKTRGKWFETQDSISYNKEFNKPKIIYPNMTSLFPFNYDESGLLGNDKSFILSANDNSISLKFLTAIFNSSLAKLWIWYNCPELIGGTREIRKIYFENFPIPQANPEQVQTLEQLTNKRTELTSNSQAESSKFVKYLLSQYPIDKLPGKLENWHKLDYSIFIKELNKVIKKAGSTKLSKSEEMEWMELFENKQSEMQAIQTEITKSDSSIDKIIYRLYNLSE